MLQTVEFSCTFIAEELLATNCIYIAKQHAVTIKLISNGIDIRGKLDDIANSKVSIKVKLQEYLKQIKKKKVLVDVLMSPILNTPIFESTVAKIKQKYGVVVSYTKCSTAYSVEVVNTLMIHVLLLIYV